MHHTVKPVASSEDHADDWNVTLHVRSECAVVYSQNSNFRFYHAKTFAVQNGFSLKVWMLSILRDCYKINVLSKVLKATTPVKRQCLLGLHPAEDWEYIEKLGAVLLKET